MKLTDIYTLRLGGVVVELGPYFLWVGKERERELSSSA